MDEDYFDPSRIKRGGAGASKKPIVMAIIIGAAIALALGPMGLVLMLVGFAVYAYITIQLGRRAVRAFAYLMA